MRYILDFNWDASWVAIGISAIALLIAIISAIATLGQHSTARRALYADVDYRSKEQARHISLQSIVEKRDDGEYWATITIYNNSNAVIIPRGIIMSFKRGGILTRSTMRNNCDITKIYPELKWVSAQEQQIFNYKHFAFDDEVKFVAYLWPPIKPGEYEFELRYSNNMYPFPFYRSTGFVFKDINNRTWTKRMDGNLFESINLGDGYSIKH